MDKKVYRPMTPSKLKQKKKENKKSSKWKSRKFPAEMQEPSASISGEEFYILEHLMNIPDGRLYRLHREYTAETKEASERVQKVLNDCQSVMSIEEYLQVLKGLYEDSGEEPPKFFLYYLGEAYRPKHMVEKVAGQPEQASPRIFEEIKKYRFEQIPRVHIERIEEEIQRLQGIIRDQVMHQLKTLCEDYVTRIEMLTDVCNWLQYQHEILVRHLRQCSDLWYVFEDNKELNLFHQLDDFMVFFVRAIKETKTIFYLLLGRERLEEATERSRAETLKRIGLVKIEDSKIPSPNMMLSSPVKFKWSSNKVFDLLRFCRQVAENPKTKSLLECGMELFNNMMEVIQSNFDKLSHSDKSKENLQEEIGAMSQVLLDNSSALAVIQKHRSQVEEKHGKLKEKLASLLGENEGLEQKIVSLMRHLRTLETQSTEGSKFLTLDLSDSMAESAEFDTQSLPASKDVSDESKTRTTSASSRGSAGVKRKILPERVRSKTRGTDFTEERESSSHLLRTSTSADIRKEMKWYKETVGELKSKVEELSEYAQILEADIEDFKNSTNWGKLTCTKDAGALLEEAIKIKKMTEDERAEELKKGWLDSEKTDAELVLMEALEELSLDELQMIAAKKLEIDGTVTIMETDEKQGDFDTMSSKKKLKKRKLLEQQDLIIEEQPTKSFAKPKKSVGTKKKISTSQAKSPVIQKADLITTPAESLVTAEEVSTTPTLLLKTQETRRVRKRSKSPKERSISKTRPPATFQTEDQESEDMFETEELAETEKQAPRAPLLKPQEAASTEKQIQPSSKSPASYISEERDTQDKLETKWLAEKAGTRASSAPTSLQKTREALSKKRIKSSAESPSYVSKDTVEAAMLIDQHADKTEIQAPPPTPVLVESSAKKLPESQGVAKKHSTKMKGIAEKAQKDADETQEYAAGLPETVETVKTKQAAQTETSMESKPQMKTQMLQIFQDSSDRKTKVTTQGMPVFLDASMKKKASATRRVVAPQEKKSAEELRTFATLKEQKGIGAFRKGLAEIDLSQIPGGKRDKQWENQGLTSSPTCWRYGRRLCALISLLYKSSMFQHAQSVCIDIIQQFLALSESLVCIMNEHGYPELASSVQESHDRLAFVVAGDQVDALEKLAPTVETYFNDIQKLIQKALSSINLKKAEERLKGLREEKIQVFSKKAQKVQTKQCVLEDQYRILFTMYIHLCSVVKRRQQGLLTDEVMMENFRFNEKMVTEMEKTLKLPKDFIEINFKLLKTAALDKQISKKCLQVTSDCLQEVEDFCGSCLPFLVRLYYIGYRILCISNLRNHMEKKLSGKPKLQEKWDDWELKNTNKLSFKFQGIISELAAWRAQKPKIIFKAWFLFNQILMETGVHLIFPQPCIPCRDEKKYSQFPKIVKEAVKDKKVPSITPDNVFQVLTTGKLPHSISKKQTSLDLYNFTLDTRYSVTQATAHQGFAYVEEKQVRQAIKPFGSGSKQPFPDSPAVSILDALAKTPSSISSISTISENISKAQFLSRNVSAD